MITSFLKFLGFNMEDNRGEPIPTVEETKHEPELVSQFRLVHHFDDYVKIQYLERGKWRDLKKAFYWQGVSNHPDMHTVCGKNVPEMEKLARKYKENPDIFQEYLAKQNELHLRHMEIHARLMRERENLKKIDKRI